MSSRYTKKIPEFIYFEGDGEWIKGPYVNKPRTSGKVRKFKLTEVHEDTTIHTGKDKGRLSGKV